MTDDNEAIRVLALQQRTSYAEIQKANSTASKADVAINVARAHLEAYGRVPPSRASGRPLNSPPPMPRIRKWEDLVAEAERDEPGEPTFADVLTRSEIDEVDRRLAGWDREFANLHRLHPYDYAIAGVAGILAGLVDVLLVQVPKHPGFLGGRAAEGGWLSNVMKDGFSKLLTPERIRALEKSYPVPFDPATNANLVTKVAGLGLRTHRMQSVGHDILLTWVFGVRDILAGTFTAIGSDGHWVVQAVAGSDPAESGIELLTKILQAFVTVGGHIASDVATPAGLPPPLFGLLQFVQLKGIGNHSISDIARTMYRSGYDLRHFLAGGLAVGLIEIIVRFAWMVGELQDGKPLAKAIPIGAQPRLQTTLLLAHSVAAAVNAGKVAITGNPLAISWAQWLAFFRYLLPQVHWFFIGYDDARSVFVTDKLDGDWADLSRRMAISWKSTFDEEYVAIL